MVTIQVKNIEGKTVLPVAGSKRAAGYDLIAIDEPIIEGVGVAKDGTALLPRHNLTEDALYRSIDFLEYHTALYISPQPDPTTDDPRYYHTDLNPRSSVRKYNLVLANGVGLVDNDYRGEIILCFKYLWQPIDLTLEFRQVPIDSEVLDGTKAFTWEPTGKLVGHVNPEKIYKKGDKIGQLVASKTNPIEFVLVSELDATERGAGGFGSTDTNPTIIPIRKPSSGHQYPQSVMDKEVEKYKADHPEAFGTIAERYQKTGGVPVKKRYSEEMKEKQQQ
jgi:dUTPase